MKIEDLVIILFLQINNKKDLLVKLNNLLLRFNE